MVLTVEPDPECPRVELVDLVDPERELPDKFHDNRLEVDPVHAGNGSHRYLI
jgi:hypothetical protein